MTFLSIIPPVLMASSCVTYVFWTQTKIDAPRRRTRIEYLRERKEVVYENLRDLNFEYRSGKYPLDDYNLQRNTLEAEAGRILSELNALESGRPAPEIPVR